MSYSATPKTTQNTNYPPKKIIGGGSRHPQRILLFAQGPTIHRHSHRSSPGSRKYMTFIPASPTESFNIVS